MTTHFVLIDRKTVKDRILPPPVRPILRPLHHPQASAHPTSADNHRRRSHHPAARLVRTVLACGTVLLQACTVGPNYQRPATSNPSTWKQTSTARGPAVLPSDWWTLFNDPKLNALEALAVDANQDLKRAVARVKEARALARSSKADRYPHFSAGAAYSHSRQSENREVAIPSTEADDFSTSFDMSYEVDLWGRIKRQTEAAQADFEATTTGLQVVLLTLTADLAKNYQQLLALDAERAVIDATVALRNETVGLQETRFRAGLINEVDVSRARTELATVEADLQSVLRQQAQIEHAIAILCGRAPADLELVLRGTDQPQAIPAIPAGLPSDLLLRRPDIVEAEQNLMAANARIGQAKAEFFPRIKLTGTAGFASADLGALVDWPSRIGQFGPSISVPIFQGGRNKANLQAAEARYEQSVATYRASVLNAFREVEDSLSDLGTLFNQAEAVNRALASARDTVSLAQERYQRGLSSYLDVVDAQRAALQAERQRVQLHGQRAVSAIQLAKALGGGWKS